MNLPFTCRLSESIGWNKFLFLTYERTFFAVVGDDFLHDELRHAQVGGQVHGRDLVPLQEELSRRLGNWWRRIKEKKKGVIY